MVYVKVIVWAKTYKDCVSLSGEFICLTKGSTICSKVRGTMAFNSGISGKSIIAGSPKSDKRILGLFNDDLLACKGDVGVAGILVFIYDYYSRFGRL